MMNDREILDDAAQALGLGKLMEQRAIGDKDTAMVFSWEHGAITFRRVP